jgi:hypothetical protein
MLSVDPGKVTEPEAFSVALSTIASVLFGDASVVGLNTTVRLRVGLSTIIPALAVVPERSTSNPLSRSRVASTMFRAGKIAPVTVGLNGFEINARKLRVLGAELVPGGGLPGPVVVEPYGLLPHETKPAPTRIDKKRALTVLFNSKLQEHCWDRNLDAKSGL